jgi:hypothetical protein
MGITKTSGRSKHRTVACPEAPGSVTHGLKIHAHDRFVEKNSQKKRIPLTAG